MSGFLTRHLFLARQSIGAERVLLLERAASGLVLRAATHHEGLQKSCPEAGPLAMLLREGAPLRSLPGRAFGELAYRQGVPAGWMGAPVGDPAWGVLAAESERAFSEHDQALFVTLAQQLDEHLRGERRLAEMESSAVLQEQLLNAMDRLAACASLEDTARALLGESMTLFDAGAALVVIPPGRPGGEWVMCAEGFRVPEAPPAQGSWCRWLLGEAGETVYLPAGLPPRSNMPFWGGNVDAPASGSLLACTLSLGVESEPGLLVLTGDGGPHEAAAVHAVKRLASQAGLVLAQKVLLEKLTSMATTDPLTGLLNRRAFDETLTKELLRADRFEEPLSLLVLDVDHFKNFNDTWGHAAGDAVLRGAAAVMRESVRDVDACARLGGEEFAVVLPNCPRAEAERVGERVRAALEQSSFSHEGQQLQVTASLGAATWPGAVRDSGSLLASADKALYKAKASGRNRVCAFTSEDR